MGSKPTKTKPSQKKPGVTLRTPLQLVIPQTNTLRKQNTFFPPSNPINEEIPAKKQIYKPPPPPKEINYNIQQQEENILDSKSISSYHFDKELEIKQKVEKKI